jgi:hypothetical protein
MLAGGRVEADVFEFTDKLGGIDRHVLMMFAAKDDGLYALVTLMPAEKWERHGSAVKDAFRTFKTWKGAFAACLKDKGAVFYGLFDCEHCREQKALFVDGTDRLPYVECKDREAGTLLEACSDKGISGYPAWDFADGSRLVGLQDLKTLSEKTGCPLPK